MALRWGFRVLAIVAALAAGSVAAAPAAAAALPSVGAVSVAQVDPNAPTGQCADASLRVRVTTDPEGSGAGHRAAFIDFQNRGHRTCSLRGAPGVSLVGHGNGTQLGVPADRATKGAAPTVRIEPGQSARVSLVFAYIDRSGGLYGTACKAQRADGYRIYPPHSFRSVFVRAAQYACTAESVHWGAVDYLRRTPVGCAANTGGVPKGAVHKRIADVDGDSQRDTEWFTPAAFGITTASGHTSEVQPDVAGGATPQALSVVLRGSSKAITLIAGSRDVQVFRFSRCELRPVTNAQGAQYRFDLSGQYGTGVSCADPDGNGIDQLIGDQVLEPDGEANGDPVTIATTDIGVNGLRGVNGRTRTTMTTLPDGAAAAARATTITCRGLTMQHDGITPG